MFSVINDRVLDSSSLSELSTWSVIGSRNTTCKPDWNMMYRAEQCRFACRTSGLLAGLSFCPCSVYSAC